jgi:hypothetical protein
VRLISEKGDLKGCKGGLSLWVLRKEFSGKARRKKENKSLDK